MLKIHKLRRLTWAMGVCLLMNANLVPGSAYANPAAGVNLAFKEADIDQVASAFGQFLNRPFFVDPRVKGKLTLEAPAPVTREQALALFSSALRVQGFALVDSGGAVRVVPEADSKAMPGPVSAGGTVRERGDQIVTQVFKLSTESATQMVNVLKPLISPNQTVSALSTGNAIVITDTAENLRRIGKIIAALDGSGQSEAEVMPLKHALAIDVASTVSKLLDDSSKGIPVDAGQRVSVLADVRSNAVLLRSVNPQRIELARRLIERLDLPTAQPGNVHVVYLRNADAAKLAQTLRSVLTGDTSALTGQSATTSSLSTGAQSGNSGQSPVTGGGLSSMTSGLASTGNASAALSTAVGSQNLNTPGIVQADVATNSLIITAPEPVYRNLRAVIDQLDVRRAQVFIESLIVEVSAEKAAEFGIQFQALEGVSQGGTQGFGGTNFGGTGQNILGPTAGALSSLGAGLNLGIVRGSFTFNGQTFLNLGLLARALESKANGNIIATPNLLTLDNEEARIIIGQNVPFVTGQYTTTAGTTTNPFQTIERRDVGTTLRVKPQVSDGGTVRMQIFQEVSSVQSQSTSGIITNRRAIESNVLVDDGQIVAIGGLIEEKLEGDESKVPGLGDVPVLGNLFRYDSRKRTKTNLLVFLRPIIVRSSDSANAVTADRYDYMRLLQGSADVKQREHWALPQFDAPVLPEVMPGRATAIDGQPRQALPTRVTPVEPANGAP